MAAPGDEIEELEGVLGHVYYPGAPGARTPQVFVDPQIGKIPRRLKDISNPAVTFASGTSNRVLLTVPDGEVWEIEGLVWRFTASATVGTRQFLVDIFAPGTVLSNGSLKKWTTRPLGNLTAGQSGRIWLSPLFNTPDATALAGDTASLREPFPFRILPSGWRVVALDNQAIDATLDTVSIEATVNSYTTPRGISQSEIPMGLESGFQWDLTDERKVH